jgi:hypothetical protein
MNIKQDQKQFLQAMKRKFSEDLNDQKLDLHYENCNMCNGTGKRKGIYYHQCGGVGVRKIK